MIGNTSEDAETLKINGFVHSRLDIPIEVQSSDEFNRFRDSWSNLCDDQYLYASTIYRKRRYGKYLLNSKDFTMRHLPHAAFYQPKEYNELVGGVLRNFEPLETSTTEGPTLHSLIRANFAVVNAVHPGHMYWHVYVHQKRITARDGGGVESAPEGIHRDGHDFLVIHVINRSNISGGSSRIYSTSKELLYQSVLQDVSERIIINDHKVLHGVTPIFQTDLSHSGERDVLTLHFERAFERNCRKCDQRIIQEFNEKKVLCYKCFEYMTPLHIIASKIA